MILERDVELMGNPDQGIFEANQSRQGPISAIPCSRQKFDQDM